MLNQKSNEKIVRLLLFIFILGLVCSLALLLPQVRNFIIDIGEKALGRSLSREYWMRVLWRYSAVIAALCAAPSISILLPSSNLERTQKFFSLLCIAVIGVSIAAIISMQIRVRSLWLDEAFLAASIVTRDWSNLLVPPLDNMQSAPALYVIAVKLLGGLLGYSEFSLRLFSFFAFIGLLLCTKEFSKKVLNYSNYQTAFVVAMSASLPTFIWYANELKPYISDALFVVLTLLCYFYYTQGKIKLPALTVLCVIFFGFSTPVIFFIGGIFIYEFIASAIAKNTKKALLVFLAGFTILVLSSLYFRWWHLPVLGGMQIFWDDHAERTSLIVRLRGLFRGSGNSNSSFLGFLVPFALLGAFPLIKAKNRIAWSTLISFILVFSASLLGFWPLRGRLWLFLPAIVLIFTPAGIDFVRNKIKYEKITNLIVFISLTALILFSSIHSLGYFGDGMYFHNQEVNPLIYHVKNNINEGEKLYVCSFARFTFEFKNGYGTKRIGNVYMDNIIFGRSREQWNQNILGDELRSIIEHERVYLLFQHHSHRGRRRIYPGLDVLQNYGTLIEVMNFHRTPLYFFERHPDSF